jgi:hypothetical protein
MDPFNIHELCVCDSKDAEFMEGCRLRLIDCLESGEEVF